MQIPLVPKGVKIFFESHSNFWILVLHEPSFITYFQSGKKDSFVNVNFGLHYYVFLLFQFVELKGSVFKKFDKNNLFQVSCSDVRERFHLFSLLFIVVVQTMKEYGWKEGKKGSFFKGTGYTLILPRIMITPYNHRSAGPVV